MTKKELIEKLITYPDNTEIMMEDPYNDGYWRIYSLDPGYYNLNDMEYSDKPDNGFDKVIILSCDD